MCFKEAGLNAQLVEVPSLGSLVLAEDPVSSALCYVGLGAQPAQEFSVWANKYYPRVYVQWGETELIVKAQVQITQYLRGIRKEFTLPITLKGTPFQLRVWDQLGMIPYGQTVAYADIALKLDKPAAVRAVGQACGANPLPIILPCHRVLAKTGGLAGYTGGLDIKRLLLKVEGISR